MKITSIKALEILDSRGKPTVRSFVGLEDGTFHSASVPSGASTGSHEAVELRDGDNARYMGQGVSKAVEHVNKTIAHAVKGMDTKEAAAIDEKMLELDGTDNKSNLGANALLSVSMAVARAGAHAEKIPLWKHIHRMYFKDISPQFPRIMVNVVNGGKHAGWNFDIQEFMIVPTTDKPSDSIRTAAEIFHQMGKNLKKKGLSTLVGDEGGYSPSLSSNEQVIDLILSSADEGGFHDKDDFNLALDVAATEFYENGSYVLKKNNQTLTPDELFKYYMSLEEKYSILSFEDPFAEDDWVSFRMFTAASSGNFMTVGDDLYVTNTKRLQKGLELQATNAVLIKLNQIGTVKETVEAIKMARGAGWKVIISHRSGETEDPFIADFAYGSAADFIKTGSMSRSERLAKYNRLLEIEHGL